MSTIDRMLRREEVQERTGLSRSAIYRLMREDDFPLPRRLGQRAVRWRESDLEAWLASRPLATGRKAAALAEPVQDGPCAGCDAVPPRPAIP